MGEMLEEWKNRVVVPTCKGEDKNRRKNIEGLAYLVHVINCIVILKMKNENTNRKSPF